MGPLTGLNILDFSTLLPGPWASQQLVDMGANVTRVVAPNRPDLLETFPHAFARINQQKDVVSVDLNSPEGRQEIEKLLTEHDIVLEQFRPGTLAKFNLDYESLRKHHPQLIYCSLTGYGQTGPYKGKAGHDINYLALSGIASYAGNGRPSLVGVQIADLAAGSQQAIIAILAAVIERNATGNGQYLDVSMADGALSLNALAISDVIQGEPSPTYDSTVLNGGSFYDYYQCECGQWLSFGALEPKFLSNFCTAIDRPDWFNRFFNHKRGNIQSLKQDLVTLFLGNTRDSWLEMLTNDCCIEPVLTIKEAIEHPLFVSREMVEANTSGGRIAPAVKFPGSKL